MVRRPSSETLSELSFDCSLERMWPSTDHDSCVQCTCMWVCAVDFFFGYKFCLSMYASTHAHVHTMTPVMCPPRLADFIIILSFLHPSLTPSFLVLPKFCSELLRRTGTGRTKQLRTDGSSSRFSNFWKLRTVWEPVRTRTKLGVILAGAAIKTMVYYCKNDNYRDS